MNLKDIAAIAGKPGLYKVLKPTRSGMIVASLDEKAKKSVVSTTHRVSILQEISIYTTDEVESVELGKVLKSAKDKHEGKVEVGSSKEELATFMEGVLPTYDVDRVYSSDIKKLVSWYNILVEFAPDTFTEVVEEVKEEEEAPKEEKKEVAKKAKATKAKAPKKEKE